MQKPLPLLFIIFLLSCNNPHHNSSGKVITTSKDSLKQKSIDSQMALGNRPDSEQQEPAFSEVLKDQLASYNKIKRIDTLIIAGKDSLRLHFKYYCLHDSSLIVPKKYIWSGKNPKDFTTNNFAMDIIIVNNKDTVLNKTFRKNDFMDVLTDGSLKKYAVIFDANFEGYNSKIKGEFLFDCSLSIPLTDVGVPAYIAVDKKGKYKILDEYAIK